jgi:hypothetical protein
MAETQRPIDAQHLEGSQRFPVELVMNTHSLRLSKVVPAHSLATFHLRSKALKAQ